MVTQLNTQDAEVRRTREKAALKSAFTASNSVIQSCLETLSTANKNRLLLLLHELIDEQLESLAATIHD
jgi:hypothetical protein